MAKQKQKQKKQKKCRKGKKKQNNRYLKLINNGALSISEKDHMISAIFQFIETYAVYLGLEPKNKDDEDFDERYHIDFIPELRVDNFYKIHLEVEAQNINSEAEANSMENSYKDAFKHFKSIRTRCKGIYERFSTDYLLTNPILFTATGERCRRIAKKSSAVASESYSFVVSSNRDIAFFSNATHFVNAAYESLIKHEEGKTNLNFDKNDIAYLKRFLTDSKKIITAFKDHALYMEQEDPYMSKISRCIRYSRALYPKDFMYKIKTKENAALSYFRTLQKYTPAELDKELNWLEQELGDTDHPLAKTINTTENVSIKDKSA